MNGRRFVVLLALLAVAAVALIVLGVPTWGAAEGVSGAGSAAGDGVELPVEHMGEETE